MGVDRRMADVVPTNADGECAKWRIVWRFATTTWTLSGFLIDGALLKRSLRLEPCTLNVSGTKPVLGIPVQSHSLLTFAQALPIATGGNEASSRQLTMS